MNKTKTQARENNPFWKGGRTIASNGYILIKDADNPNADVRGYVYEHRMVAQKILGRPLLHEEIVHHKDGNKLNNSPENIEIVVGNFEHYFLHRSPNSNKRKPGEENPILHCACGCGAILTKYDNSNRPRRFISGHNFLGGNKNAKN
jgi:hypothetical protein